MALPTYKANDPKGFCGDPKRGAALGRSTVTDENAAYEGRIYVRRVRISNDGYDPNGTYFGVGDPVYWFANSEGTIDFVKRAVDRNDALAHVRERYPKAKTR
jgi:hypothetical protein